MTKPTPPPVPECAKLSTVSDESQAIGEFLEWLRGKGIVLATWSEDRKFGSRLKPFRSSTNQLLADYFEIDLNKVEEERRALLDYMQELNNAG